MKQLNYPVEDEIAEFIRVINAKHLETRAILNRLIPTVTIDFNLYIENFNNIVNLGVNQYNNLHSDLIRKCYDTSTKPLEALKARLVNSQIEKMKLLCPYCLIINYSTFDHYVPKEAYPVYSVLAKNIIQCCDTCNKKKLEYWRLGDERGIIHFYIDNYINNYSFLFCELTFNEGTPIINFWLDFSSIDDDRKVMVINRHYSRLDLLNRYNKNAANVISDKYTTINAIIRSMPINQEIIRAILINESISLKELYGINYWTALIIDALADSEQFLNYFIS
jgi:hypothetical protein